MQYQVVVDYSQNSHQLPEINVGTVVDSSLLTIIESQQRTIESLKTDIRSMQGVIESQQATIHLLMSDVRTRATLSQHGDQFTIAEVTVPTNSVPGVRAEAPIEVVDIDGSALDASAEVVVAREGPRDPGDEDTASQPSAPAKGKNVECCLSSYRVT